MKVHLSLNRRTSSKLSLCYWKISLFIKLIQGPDEGERHIKLMTFYRESQEGISYGLGGRLICLLHISTLVFVGEEIQGGHRKGTSHITGLCVHQQRGPAGPSANIGSQSVDHLEAQASEVSVGKYHTVIHPRISHCLLYAFIFVERAWNGRASELWAAAVCGLPSLLSCSFPALISGHFLSHSEPSQMPLPQSCDSGCATRVSWWAVFIPKLSLKP